VSLAHADAYRVSQALIDVARVIPDFRPPNVLRLGPAPAYTRFVDVWDAMDRLRNVMETRAYERFDPRPGRVT